MAEQLIRDRPCGVGNLVCSYVLAPEFNRHTDLSPPDISQINGDQVHGDPANHVSSLPIDHYRCATWCMPWISIAITDGHDADEHIFRTGPGPAITDCFTLTNVVDCDQRRCQAHHWPEVFTNGIAQMKRAGSVEHDTGTDPFIVAFRMSHNSRRVCATGLKPIGRNHLIKDLDLGLCIMAVNTSSASARWVMRRKKTRQHYSGRKAWSENHGSGLD
jgi:hypothetical protein